MCETRFTGKEDLMWKKVGSKIQTKEDIIKYAPEFLKYMERR
jgi:hypothetical protein